ncbi:hypothetical protein NDU88_003651, partial [Pleurodeles waltl]
IPFFIGTGAIPEGPKTTAKKGRSNYKATRRGKHKCKPKQTSRGSGHALNNSQCPTVIDTPDPKNDTSSAISIVNLSSRILSPNQTNMLKKGLGFVPTTLPDFTELHISLFKFVRKCKLYKYFYDVNTQARATTTLHHTPSTMTIKDVKDIQTLLSIEHQEGHLPTLTEILTDLNIDTNPRTYSDLKISSKFTPIIPRDFAIDSFCNKVTSELYHMEEQYLSGHKSIPWHNITLAEKQALISLGTYNDIIIKEADKGGNIVIMDRADYISELDRQVSDRSAYLKLTSNPMPEVNRCILRKLQTYLDQDLISDMEFKYLYNNTPTSPCIYILPKIHKPGTFPPGRPIISGIGSPTEKLSEYIDIFLQPFVRNLPSYIRDTKDLLCKITDYDWTDGHYLVTLDVTSLYTSIQRTEGLTAILHYLDTRDAALLDHTNMLMDLISLVLDNNVFLHNGCWYRQIQGVAMGAKFSPSYASLYMGYLEKVHV